MARVLWVSGLFWVAHLLRAGRGLFPGAVGVWRRGAYSARGFGFILFVMRWIIPLCLILIAFFPPFSARVETSAQKPLI